jgi:tetratricopeptide (TPR) repeat protein
MKLCRPFLLLLIVTATLAAPSQFTAMAKTSSPQAFEQAIEATKVAMMADPQEALAKAKVARRIADQMPSNRQSATARATAYWLEAEALLGLNRLDEAKATVDPAIKLVEANARGSKLHGDLLRARGAVAALTGNVQQALTDYLGAHRIFAKLGITRSVAITLQDIANVYWEGGDYARTLRYLDEANDLYSDDPGFALSSFNSKAEALRKLGRLGDAEQNFQIALKHARALESPLLQTRILSNLALVQIESDKLAAAAQNAALALRLSEADEARDWRVFVFGLQAMIAAKQGNDPLATQLLERTFANVDLARTDLAYRDFHALGAAVFERTGNLALANAHLKARYRLESEAAKLVSTNGAQLLAAEFDFANQNLRISKLKQGAIPVTTAACRRVGGAGRAGADAAVLHLHSPQPQRSARCKRRAASQQPRPCAGLARKI